MFKVKDAVFVKDLDHKKMVILHKGAIVNPRLIDGNECIVSFDNGLFSMTKVIFKLFFEKI